jgi:hypothetical protein
MRKLLVFTVLSTATMVMTAQKFVTPNGAGTQDGSSWRNASNNIQDMINLSMPGDEVWVAKGVYTPESRANNTWAPTPGDRCNSFVITSDSVEVYGGFAGWEWLVEQRDWKNNVTILDGYLPQGLPCIALAYNPEPKCPLKFVNHVVVIAGVNHAVLDGFTVKRGFAGQGNNILVNGTIINDDCGGGIVVSSANAIRLKNLIIEDNEAEDKGGGVLINNSYESLLQNIIFRNNSNSNNYNFYFHNTITPSNYNYNSCKGGGICISDNSNPTLVNVLFHNNRAGEGGGAFIENSEPMFINNTMADNSSYLTGDGIFCHGNSYPKFYNSIIWNTINIYTPTYFDRCLVMNMFPTGNNLDGNIFNPDFVNSNNFNYHLSPNSPCIDAGNQNYVNSYTQIDLDGNYRVAVNDVDMGVYELESEAAPSNIVNQKSLNGNNTKQTLETIESNLNLYVFPNPTNKNCQTTIYLGNDISYYEKSVDIKIYAMDGRLVYNKNFSNGNIQASFSSLSLGIYRISLLTREGEHYTQKLVIIK